VKQLLTKIFWFVLSPFEKGEDPYEYKPSSRTILIIVGILFSGLSGGSLFFSIQQGEYAAFLPIIVFFCVGAVSLIIGFLGSDRAVASLWGTGNKRSRR